MYGRFPHTRWLVRIALCLAISLPLALGQSRPALADTSSGGSVPCNVAYGIAQAQWAGSSTQTPLFYLSVQTAYSSGCLLPVINATFTPLFDGGQEFACSSGLAYTNPLYFDQPLQCAYPGADPGIPAVATPGNYLVDVEFSAYYGSQVGACTLTLVYDPWYPRTCNFW